MDKTFPTVDDDRSEEHSPGADASVPPGPDGWPIVGNTVEFMRDSIGTLDDLAGHGDVVRYRLLGNTWTAVFHPDHVQRVLVDESDRFEQFDFGDFVTSTTGKRWFHLRTLAQPAFTPERVGMFADGMVEETVELVEQWEDGETIAANEVFSALTLEILTKTLFDFDVGERRDVITEAARMVNDKAAVGPSVILPEWVPTPSRRRFDRTMARFDDIVASMIDERRRDDEGRTDLISIVLESERASETDQGRLTDEEIRDLLVTVVLAGHETSGMALTYATMLLAHHSDVRERLEREVDDVCGNRDPTMGDVPALEYTEMVVDEALRLYPPAYIVGREVREDVVFDGYLVREGTKVSVSPYVTHRDERWWDDPETFDPDRWRREDPDRPEYAYFPFGGGPRHCLGMRFARLELQLVLATLARRVRFDLESDPEPDTRASITLRPVEDVLLTVRHRQ